MAITEGNDRVGIVRAVCVSSQKRGAKHCVGEAVFKEDFGIVNDAHAGSHRQVSLLAEEAIEKAKSWGADVGFGDFGENISTAGIALKELPIGAKIKIGEDAILEITQIGKTCVSRCAIYYKTGGCIMPQEGVFAKVLKGGVVKAGERIEVLSETFGHTRGKGGFRKMFYFFGLMATLFFISPAVSAQISEAKGKGYTVFSENCAVCHTIGAGDEAVPDLKGVTQRRSGVWLKSFIQSPSKMIKARDPIAMELLAKYKEPMSDTELTPEEVDAVIEYLRDPQAVTGSSIPKGSGISPGQDKASKRSAARADVERGRALFRGNQSFFHGGPSCISCHEIRNSTILGGGRLAKELTASYSRLGEARTRAILEKSPFPLMREAYQENPLTDDEIAALSAFLEQADKEQGGHHPAHYVLKMLFLGIAGLIALVVFYGALWSNRRNVSVNKDIYDRQDKSKNERLRPLK